MGYRVGAQCFADPSEAAQAFCGSVAGMTASGFMRCNFAEWQDPSVFYSYSTVAPDGSEMGQSGNAYLSACAASEPMTAADGIALGWMVGGAWLAVFALLFMTRGLRGHT